MQSSPQYILQFGGAAAARARRTGSRGPASLRAVELSLLLLSLAVLALAAAAVPLKVVLFAAVGPDGGGDGDLQELEAVDRRLSRGIDLRMSLPRQIEVSADAL